jgi:catecholate siderophore receptor
MRASLVALAAALAAASFPAAAHAEPVAPAGRAEGALQVADADTTRRLPFDIPAQPLARALHEFGRQADLRVSLDGTAAAGVRSAAVAGTFTAAQALRVLLAGTGYQARFADAHSVVVRAAGRDSGAQALERVVVTGDASRRAGYAPRRTSSATRTDTPLRDVPQAVTVVGRELMADQAMQSMAEVVRYVPGIAMGQGEGHRDAPTIRGTSSTADFFVDGVRDDAQYLRDVYNVERVEALKGSNAMIFGRGGGGGVINRVTKDAQWAPTRALTLEGGSFEHRRATVDVGQGLGRAAAVRLNGLYENSGVFRDVTTLERQGINPTAAFLAGGTLVRLGYEYFLDRRTVDRGIPSFQGRPSNADITTFFGDPDASHSRSAVHAATATVERGSLDGVMVRNRTRVASYDKFYQNVFPGATVSEDGSAVTLSAYSNATDRRNLFNQTDVTYAVATGPVRQTLLVGAELGHQATDNFRRTGFFDDSAATLVVPFATPRATAPATFRQSATDADAQSVVGLAALYAQDQLALGEHWQAVAGVRFDRFDLRYDDRRSGRELRRRDEMFSPRAGLVFKPLEPLSLYGSYSISYLPSSGDQFSSLSTSTVTLEPERFTNRELGLKWEPRHDLSLTGAFYRLDRTNTSAPDPNDPALLVQTGQQRTTGYELGVSGNLTSAWQIAGGYAVQRATIVSRTVASPAGATSPLVPHASLSLWNRYQLTRRFGAGVGVIHQGDMYAAINNEVTLPGFTRLDAAAYLRLHDDVRLQLNVENLLDERYYATSHGNNNIMPGASRTLRVSVTATP